LSDLHEFLRRASLRTDGPFTLRSGVVSSWYLDARRTTFDGEGAVIVAHAVLAVLDESVVAVGGMTMGADPIAVSTAVIGTGLGRALAAFSIRKQTKAHGVGGRLVGAVDRGDRVAILEDTTTTGGALVEAVDVAVEHGLQVVQAITLVDRSGTRAGARMARRGVPYVALVQPGDLGVDE
jgi:orotate phosphoribosyltransferase